MSRDSEWFGEPHTIVVHEVTPPLDQFDDGELDYDLEHLPSCPQEELSYSDGVNGGLVYTCDIAWHEMECGLPSALSYSGTPITKPGTYRIQGWGRKTYYYWTGDEVDTGVAVMDPEAAA